MTNGCRGDVDKECKNRVELIMSINVKVLDITYTRVIAHDTKILPIRITIPHIKVGLLNFLSCTGPFNV